MQVVLIHGKDTDPTKKWYPWFGKEIEGLGHEYVAPVQPKPNDPVIDEWLAEIDKTKPHTETIFVGHSRGGVAVLRWLENQPQSTRVKKVILVATNSGRLADMAIPAESNYGFYTDAGYDFEKIKMHCDDFVVLHSTDDEYVPFTAGEMNAEGLSARFMQFSNRGHFGRKVSDIPELLNEVLVASL